MAFMNMQHVSQGVASARGATSALPHPARLATTHARRRVVARIALDDDEVATRIQPALPTPLLEGVQVLVPHLEASLLASPSQVAPPPNQVEDTSEEPPARVPWYERPCKGWDDIQDVTELMRVTGGNTDGKYVVIEFYAGWCASCKGSFQAVCKIAQDKKLAQHYNFYKANCEDESLFWWIKRNEVRGLPHIAVWSPQGDSLVGTSCSFKKIAQVKQALHTIIDNPDSRRFGFDPQGTLNPLDKD